LGRVVLQDIDYTSIDYEGLRNDMIECIKLRIPEYTDFSESDFGVVMAELFAHGLDVISYYTDRQVNELFLATCKDRKSALKIASQMSYTPAHALPAKFHQVFKVTPSSSGYLIPKGFKVSTEANQIEPQIMFEVEEDFSIPPNATGIEQDANDEYLYQASIVQGATMSREILGTSDGTAGQEFQLGYEPVILDSLFIEVYNNDRYERWTKVDNFINSIETDRHFTASTDEFNTVTVRFGDGIRGAIPTTYENGIVASYRVGGGTFGNVGAGKIVSLVSHIRGLESTFNPATAYESGVDQETLEELKRNIPASVNSLGRAVTLNDYDNLILATNKVFSSKTLKTGTLATTVYILPEDPEQSQGAVVVSQSLINELTQYLSNKVMVGTTFTISAATIKTVNLSIRFRASSSVYTSQVSASISSMVHSLLDLGCRGIGEELYLSDIISALSNTETGVEHLRSVFIDSPTTDIVIGSTSTASTMLESEVIVLGTLSVGAI